ERSDDDSQSYPGHVSILSGVANLPGALACPEMIGWTFPLPVPYSRGLGFSLGRGSHFAWGSRRRTSKNCVVFGAVLSSVGRLFLGSLRRTVSSLSVSE